MWAACSTRDFTIFYKKPVCHEKKSDLEKVKSKDLGEISSVLQASSYLASYKGKNGAEALYLQLLPAKVNDDFQ